MSVGPELDELLDRWQAGWAGRERDAFAVACAPDVHYEDPIAAQPLEGVTAVETHARLLRRVFPDARLERTGERLTDGRYVAAPCKVLGTHRGEIEGLPPTGRFLIVHGVVYAELREGRLLRARAFFDVHDAGIQLGVFPKPGTAGQRALLMLRGFGLRNG